MGRKIIFNLSFVPNHLRLLIYCHRDDINDLSHGYMFSLICKHFMSRRTLSLDITQI